MTALSKEPYLEGKFIRIEDDLILSLKMVYFSHGCFTGTFKKGWGDKKSFAVGRIEMKAKIITAGNCPICGKPIEMEKGNEKHQRLFLCSECGKKSEEYNKNHKIDKEV